VETASSWTAGPKATPTTNDTRIDERVNVPTR